MYYIDISLFIIHHCVGPVTKSDIGPLSGRYKDSELPEDKKAGRIHSNLVSPVNIWTYLRRSQAGYLKEISCLM